MAPIMAGPSETCPDEEGIETRPGDPRVDLDQGASETCPDEEGIETSRRHRSTSSPIPQRRAPMKRGLKPQRPQVPVDVVDPQRRAPMKRGLKLAGTGLPLFSR